MGKSIYISISCLGFDSELEQTVESALKKSSKNHIINVGIAFAGNETFYNYFKNKYDNNENIKLLYSNIKDAFGVAKGRILSSSMYSDEDYFLQIDAHTLFDNDWDSILINNFVGAQEYTGNDKVILSAPLGEYWYEYDNDVENIKYNKQIGYTKWLPGQFWMNCVPKFMDLPPEFVSEKIFNSIKNTGFAPASKIIGMFIFGGKDFAKNLCIDESIIFWEEEIFQSIELIHKGFTLVHPGLESPMFHFPFNRSNDSHYREDFDIFLKTMNINIEQYEDMIKNNYARLCNASNNAQKIARYTEYSGVNIINGVDSFDVCPSYFINSKNDIILR